jgi:hypothetical protein
MTKFQELKGKITQGRCELCNGYTDMNAGAKNVRIVSCTHMSDQVTAALKGEDYKLELFKGAAPEFGGFTGVVFVVKNESPKSWYKQEGR